MPNSPFAFIPINITQKISFEKLKSKIFIQNTDTLVDFNSLGLARGDFLENKGVGFKTITNGVQHIAIRNNTKDRADGGKQSYKDREAMRTKVKELIWDMLQEKEFPRGTRKKVRLLTS